MFIPSVFRFLRKPSLALAGAVACTAVLSPALHAAPFQNGSFESNGGNLSTSVTGWTLNDPNNSLLAINNHGTTDGVYAIAFNTTNMAAGGILSQSFTTTQFQVYRVTLDFGAFAFDNTTSLSRLQVEARDGVSIGSGTELITPASGTITSSTGGSLNQNTSVIQMSDSSGATAVNLAAPNAEFSSVTFLFTALSANTTLVFTDLSAGGADAQDAVLDNVRIAAVVPEPSAWAVVAAGTGLLGFVLRRRGSRPALGK